MTRSYFCLCLFMGFIFLLWPNRQCKAQLFLNEACSDNEQIISDDFGDYSDWIELYNAGDDAIDLQDYFLSDDNDIIDKWSFPNISIPAKSFLLVFASGRNTVGSFLHTNFKLSKEGENLILSRQDGTSRDELSLPALEKDFSYGRQADGTENLFIFSTPSPGTSNNSNTPIFKAPVPQLEDIPSFSDQAINLAITCTVPNCQIRYTLDGSIPDDNALLYTGPIAIDTTTCIRAASLVPGFLPSPTITHTYFIQTDHELPIVSLATPPDYLWDWETGIFEKGPNAELIYPCWGANFWEDTEIPMHLEYFTPDGNRPVQFDLGTRIHGGKTARNKPMKTLRLSAKASFGDTVINYPFFEEKTITDFKRIILRNASGDFNIAHLRDAFLHRYFLKEQLHLDLLAHRPVVVYINGIYWGVMNIREKIDEFYLQQNHPVDLDKIDLLEQNDLIVQGDFEVFDSMQAYVDSHNLNLADNFSYVQKHFDLEEIADYFIVETYVNNTDWPVNNLKFWRERKEGGRWRYILFDLDVAMGAFNWTMPNSDGWAVAMSKKESRHVLLLQKLLQNDSYRQYFLNRYADLVNTVFSTNQFQQEIEASAAEIEKDLALHFKRWNSDFTDWREVEILKLMDFAAERPDYALQYLQDYFNLPGQVTLELATYPSDAGQISINTINPKELPWHGIYFEGIPVQLSIEANPGYTFSHWGSLNGMDADLSAKHLVYSFDKSDEIVAYFDTEYSGLNLQLSPNPAEEELRIQLELPKPEKLRINIFDLLGKMQLSLNPVVLNGGYQEISISLEDLSPGQYHIQIVTNDKSASSSFVILN